MLIVMYSLYKYMVIHMHAFELKWLQFYHGDRFSSCGALSVTDSVAAVHTQCSTQQLWRTLSDRFSGCGAHSVYNSAVVEHTQYDIKSPENVCQNFGPYLVCPEAAEARAECTLEQLWRTLNILCSG